MNTVRGIGPFFLMMVLSSGCTTGQKFHYHDLMAPVSYQGSSSLAVGVYDNRSYVINGEKVPEYTGFLRGGFGNPLSSRTKSGNPLAMDITNSLAATFRNCGFQVAEVIAPPLISFADFTNMLFQNDADRYLLFVVNEWRHETFIDTQLFFDVKLEGYGKQGKKLAENTINGEDDIPGSAWNPAAAAKEAVPTYWSKHFSELLNSPKIRKALVP